MTRAFQFLFVLGFLVMTGNPLQSQESKDPVHLKGKFFAYWGWNRDAYTKSDLHFKGTDYDFTLSDVIAKDRQSPFKIKTYLSPVRLTIPQYNLRIGYYFDDHYQISFGADHMKYVMQNIIDGEYQQVEINGYIGASQAPYTGTFNKGLMNLTPSFLLFEHTDGLNYENVEVRRHDVIWGTKHMHVATQAGLGLGVLVPKTNTTLMNNARYDEFHLAGFGTAAVVALNLSIYKYFFIQSEFKAGYINMPDIRTTMNKADKASQHFWFDQYNILFGANFNIHAHKAEAKK